MKKALLLIAITQIIIGHNLNAQTVDISNEKFSIDLNYYIEDVIVAQKEKEILGFTIMPRTELKFNKPIDEELKDFFVNNYPSGVNKSPLILKINKIYISGNNEYSITDLNVSFLIKDGSDYVELLNSGTKNIHTWISFLMIGNSNKYGYNLINAFKGCFTDFKKRLENQTLKPRSIKEGNLQKFVNPYFAILNNPQPLKGVFYGLSDFIDNNIDTTVAFSIDQKAVSDTHSVKIKFANDIEKNIWGVCDGEKYYLFFKKNFYPIQIQQNTVSAFIDSYDLNSDGGFLSEFGGLIGYAIDRAFDAATSKIVKTEIDLLTGKLIDINRLQDFVFECRSNKNKEEICIYFEDEKLACLKKGEYLRYKNSSIVGIEKFTLKTNTATEVIRCSVTSEQSIVIINKGDRIIARYAEVLDPVLFIRLLEVGSKEVGQNSILNE